MRAALELEDVEHQPIGEPLPLLQAFQGHLTGPDVLIRDAKAPQGPIRDPQLPGHAGAERVVHPEDEGPWMDPLLAEDFPDRLQGQPFQPSLGQGV